MDTAAKLGACIFSAAKMVKRVQNYKPQKDDDVNINNMGRKGEHNDCDTDNAMVTVGAEVFYIAKTLFRSRRPSNHAVPGLSTTFTAHRNEVRGDLVRTNASVQSIIVAEGLMGIRNDLDSGNAQMAHQLADGEGETVDGVRYAVTEGLKGIRYAVREGSMVAYKSLEEILEMRGDIERLEQVIVDAREDCERYFNEFSSKLKGAPLKHARAALREFTSSGGDLECLDDAYEYARDALSRASSPEARFNASIILVTTGYARTAKRQSPGKAKTLVLENTFMAVAGNLAPYLYNTSAISLDASSFITTTDGSRVVAFLLDIVSFIFLLPPANVLLPQLPRPLVEALGVLCAYYPQKWINIYPEVGITALRFVLNNKFLGDLCWMAQDLGIDISICENKSDVIQALLDAEKPLPVMDPPYRKKILPSGQRSKTGHHSTLEHKLDEKQRELDRTKEKLGAVNEERIKYKELLNQHTARELSRPNAGAQQVGQTFLTLGKIRDRIRATMDNIVNPWTETIVDLGESSKLQGAGSIPRVLLPKLFLLCLDEVRCYRRSIVRFFLGNRDDRTEEDMEPATATFMLEHMRQHQSTIFPLKAGEAVHNEARCRVLEYIIEHLTKELHMKDHELTTNLINASGTATIVDAYFEIIVNAVLQDPPAVFNKECGGGTVQFDPNLHETSHVDGGAFADSKNKMCTVVFPALLQSTKEPLRWTKSFIIEG